MLISAVLLYDMVWRALDLRLLQKGSTAGASRNGSVHDLTAATHVKHLLLGLSIVEHGPIGSRVGGPLGLGLLDLLLLMMILTTTNSELTFNRGLL